MLLQLLQLLAMELSLGEWLVKHKAAEYEAMLRAEGCECVEVRPSTRA